MSALAIIQPRIPSREAMIKFCVDKRRDKHLSSEKDYRLMLENLSSGHLEIVYWYYLKPLN